VSISSWCQRNQYIHLPDISLEKTNDYILYIIYYILYIIYYILLLWFGCGWQQKCQAAAPPPAGVRRRMERNRQKLVGRDKGSLTE